MPLPYEFNLAGRNLTRHLWHSLAMVLGLALAVLVMIYVGSTMASFYDDIIDRAVEQNSAHITIWPREKPRGQIDAALRASLGSATVLAFDDRTFPRHHDLNGYHAVAKQVADCPGVTAVAGFIQGNATVSRGRTNLGISLVGIEPDAYRRVVNIAKHFPDGIAPKLGPSDIAIGFRMAEKLGVHPGEHLYVATADVQRLMRVKAIFRSGYYEKDLSEAFVSLRTAQGMLAMGNEVSAIAARCGDLQSAGDVTVELLKRLPFKVRNWMDDNASLLAEIATVNRVTFFVNVLVAAVAAVGMANVFSMFVLNRQKELAILRAMGASRWSLRSILLLEALLIWLAGTAIGCATVLGVMAYEQSHPYQVSAETYGIGTYATQPKAFAFMAAIVLAAATMFGSAWWSGRRAAKLNPAEVIFGR
jgi:lipoprotein-releasing system permease protein